MTTVRANKDEAVQQFQLINKNKVPEDGEQPKHVALKEEPMHT
jgi:hypothetical protein